MDKQALLTEVEDLLRTMPERSAIRHTTPENQAWFGRAAALVARWNIGQTFPFGVARERALQPDAHHSTIGINQILELIYQMRMDLLLEVRGPLSTSVGHGMVFDYFDQLRKIIESARVDLLFIDRYLDAEFVSQYLPHVGHGVAVHLLTRDKVTTLIPAVKAFAQQNKAAIEVRVAQGFHDRYVFVDQRVGYQSGASFKDGGRTAPTTLTQVTDTFTVVLKTYETMWSGATAA